MPAREVRVADPIEGGSESREGTRDDDALREVTTSFSFFGVCVNDCGRRLSIKVKLS